MIGRGRRRGPPPPPWGTHAGAADGDEGRVAVGGGDHLWFRVVGSGERTLVVPTAGNADDFARLAAPDRRIVFYDVRGRGRSSRVDDPRRRGFVHEVEDLEVVRRAFGLERTSILGWSYHAGVAVTFALQRPEHVDRLVLVAAIPPRAGVEPRPARDPTPAQLAHLDQLEASGLRERDPAALCRAWRDVYVPLLMGDPTAYAAMAAVCDLPNEWPWNVARSMVHVFADLATYDWRPHLRRLDRPVLVVHGSEDRDPVEVAHEWVDALPDARLLVVEGAGQLPWVERPALVADVVGRFVDGAAV